MYSAVVVAVVVVTVVPVVVVEVVTPVTVPFIVADFDFVLLFCCLLAGSRCLRGPRWVDAGRGSSCF